MPFKFLEKKNPFLTTFDMEYNGNIIENIWDKTPIKCHGTSN
jgi:hypothetical protein